MAVRPSPDRSDLESKTREDLQTIAQGKGRRRVGASFQGLTHRSDHGRPRTRFDQRTQNRRRERCVHVARSPPPTMTSTTSSASSSRTPLSLSSETASATESTTEDAPAPAPSANGTDRPQQNPRQNAQPRQDRQPRDFTNDTAVATVATVATETVASASAVNQCPTPTSPTRANSSRIEGLLDLRDDGYGFLRTKELSPVAQRRVRLHQPGPSLPPA